MEYVFFWLTFSVVAGVVAASRGRSGFGYFLLSLLLTPLVGLVLAVALPSKVPGAAGPADDAAARVACPQCAELILPSAKICRFCQSPVALAASSLSAEPHDNASFGLWGVLCRVLAGRKDSHRYPPE